MFLGGVRDWLLSADVTGSGCQGWGGVGAKAVGMEVWNGGVGLMGLMLQGLRSQ